ncbi:MAG: hypothetical protein EXR72_08115 [Myxococcales bacterium]|nr:hypothetical protein [Myxococcales bacterium]
MRARVEGKDGKPVADARFDLIQGGKVIFSGATGEGGAIEKPADEGTYQLRINSIGAPKGGASTSTAGQKKDGKTLHPIRQKSLDLAKEYILKISDRAGPDGNREGWELLADIWETAYHKPPKDLGFLPGIKAPGKPPQSWCGIFCAAMIRKAGVDASQWVIGKGPTGLASGAIADQNFEPGDILILKDKDPAHPLIHHCLLETKSGSSLGTIDGNSWDPASGKSSTVTTHKRSASDIAYYYKAYPEVWVDEAGAPADEPPAEGPLAMTGITAVPKGDTGTPTIITLGPQGSSVTPAKAPPPAEPPPAKPAEPPPDDDKKILKHDDPRLSDHRKKLLAELDLRLPSQSGAKAAPGKKNLFDGTSQTAGTSCGLLPTVLMQYGMGFGLVNGKVGVFGYGTEGMKEEGRRLGAWVESDGTALPKPGDLYTLRYEDDPNGDRVSHVGVIVDLDPNEGSTWVTGDSGQDSGPVRGAKYCNRPMQKVDGTHLYLKGEYSNNLRRVGGWVDLDKLMAALGK